MFFCVVPRASAFSSKGERARRQYILSERGRHALVRAAAKSRMKARQVRNKTNATVSVRTVQRSLQRDTNLVFGPFLPKPKLESYHLKCRLAWARVCKCKTAAFWRKVVFNDEKRFSLDVPDGQASLWLPLASLETYFRSCSVAVEV